MSYFGTDSSAFLTSGANTVHWQYDRRFALSFLRSVRYYLFLARKEMGEARGVRLSNIRTVSALPC